MEQAVIVGYARTPIGKFGGALRTVPAVALGGYAIGAALDRASVDASAVDQVIMGHVIQAGQGQITARQAARRAGISMDVPALTINKVCLSGLAAVALADQQIRLGEADVVVAGGMESMSSAPYVVPGARSGLTMGNAELVDAMIHDGLWCAFDNEHMGAGSDRLNARYGISRAAQDEWAARSHERAVEGWKNGRLRDEVVPVEVPQPKGDPVVIDIDEGLRPGTSPESLAGLRPAFSADGTITAGNASQLSDGAAALVLTSRRMAEEQGLRPLASVRSYGTVAGPDPSLHHQPAEAIRRAAEKLARRDGAVDGPTDPAGFDLYEINEAFAAVALHSTDMLGIGADRVNPNGGAVAIGHPIGASGARLAGTLISELGRRGGGRGVAALCGGGGQGDAVIFDVS